MMEDNNGQDLGIMLRQQRVMAGLTLRDLAVKSGISASHLGRIERRERFPSASVLRKLAGPLGFKEGELFSLAGYLSSPLDDVGNRSTGDDNGQLDPYVRGLLSQEPIEVQRTVIGILSILKSVTRVSKWERN